MNLVLETINPYLISSIIGFLISMLVTEYYGKDYTALITAGGVLLIGLTPLIIVLFFKGDFTSSFYLWEMSWAPGFLAGNIVDLFLHPFFKN